MLHSGLFHCFQVVRQGCNGGANFYLKMSRKIGPVFFSLLGKQKDMPISMAVPAVSTLGYLGILMGPAAIGFLAHQTSLYAAFGLLAFLVALQALIAAYVYKKVL